MIKFHIDKANLVVNLQPEGPLEEKDFAQLTSAVDDLIAAEGDLAGLIIETESFPGWQSLGAMVKHIQFVKNHHRKIKKIALVTNTQLAYIAENIMSHFIAAEIKKFPAGNHEAAKDWIING